MFTLILLCTIVGADEADVRPGERVLALCEKLPDWPFQPVVPETDGSLEKMRQEDARRFERILAELNQSELDDIRAGLERYTKSPGYRPECAYIIMQYVFQIPESGTPLAKHMRFAFDAGGPSKAALPPSWPWRQREDGTMKFERNISGIVRLGRPYRPLEVFDHYRRHFERRKTPSP